VAEPNDVPPDAFAVSRQVLLDALTAIERQANARAADVLRAADRQACEVARNSAERADLVAQAAAEQARETLDEAEVRARNVIAEAQAEAQRLVAAAQRTLSQAEARAEQLIALEEPRAQQRLDESGDRGQQVEGSLSETAQRARQMIVDADETFGYADEASDNAAAGSARCAADQNVRELALAAAWQVRQLERQVGVLRATLEGMLGALAKRAGAPDDRATVSEETLAELRATVARLRPPLLSPSTAYGRRDALTAEAADPEAAAAESGV
jgi:hypothetical protein